MVLADHCSSTTSWRKGLLLRSPRALGVLAQLVGVGLDTYSSRSRAETPKASIEAPLARSALGGSYLIDGGPRESSNAGRPAEYLRSRSVDAIDEDLIEDSVGITIRALEAISDWAWNPEAQAARQNLLIDADYFAAAAEQLVNASGARWWWERMDRGRQFVLGTTGRPFGVGHAEGEHVHNFRDVGWALPNGAISTTGLGSALPAIELCDVEAMSRVDWPVGCWHLPIDEDARVFEVLVPSDWLDLCERYPRVRLNPREWLEWGISCPRALSPDWLAVARDWDAVHISMSGLITTVGLPLVSGIYGVLIEGIDTERTVWFRSAFGTPTLVAALNKEDADFV